MKKLIKVRCGSSHYLKWNLKMRLTTLLLLVSLFQIKANTYSQNTKLSLSMESVPIEEVLNKIEKETEFNFLVDIDEVDINRIVTINVDKKTIAFILDQIFLNTNVRYQVYKKQVILKVDPTIDVISIAKIESNKTDQDKNITGTVTDIDGVPLPGVNILIVGTDKGVSTDFNGNYSIAANEGDVLEFSYIGMNNIQITVASSTNIDVVMEGDYLDEIVVTALGIKREEKSLGYSVQKIGGKAIQEVKGVNVATSLTGKVAGLTIKNSTEFNKSPDILLRGAIPLLVIDGVPYGNMNLNNIAADDIESMSVLKGATASALYGTRGGNGAIIITTKNSGQGISINSNIMFFAGNLVTPEVQHSYSAGLGGIYSATDYTWGGKMDIGTMVDQWNPETKQIEQMELQSRGKNNYQNFLEPGIIANTNVSLSHTGENGSIRGSFTHIYNKGQYPNLKSNSMLFSLSGKVKITEKFEFLSQIGYNRSNAPQTIGAGYGNQGYIYQILIWTGAEYDLTKYQDYWLKPHESQNWHYKAWYDNPYLIAYEKLRGEVRNIVNTNFTLKYDVFEGANLLFRFGYDFYANQNLFRSPPGINSKRNEGIQWNTRGLYGQENDKGYSLNSDVIFNYNKEFGDFGLDFLGGISLYKFEDQNITSSTRGGLVIPNFYSLNNSLERPNTSSSVYGKQVNSAYGKVSFSYAKKVYVDVTGRNDWSSTLPSETRSFFYPSVGASVIVDEFFNNPSWLDFWKIRGSWTVSKKDLPVYATNQSYTIQTGVWDGLNAATYPTTIRNSQVDPETNRSIEFGTAAYFFKKRLTVDFAVYNIYNYNIQRNATISEASGFESTLINIAESYERKGMELTLGGTIIKKKDFTWNAMVNLSRSHNYFKSLDSEYSADNLWTKVGGRTDNYTSNTWEYNPSGAVIHGTNGQPIWGNYRRFLGYADPNLIWGITNDFTYKNFNFHITFDGRQGGRMNNGTSNKMYDTGSHPDTDNQWRYDEVVNGLTNYVGNGVVITSGDVTYDKYGQILSDTRQYAPNTISTSYESYARSYRDGFFGVDPTFFKLRELSLGYTVPTKTSKKWHLSRAHVALTAQNVFLWSKEFKMSDPDIGFDDLNSPSQRYVGFNIQLGFGK